MGEATTSELRRTWCGLCHRRCGLLLRLVGARVVGVAGDPAHPRSRGRLCPRGALAAEQLDHEARLAHPLKRVGPRGAGQWQRLSWDQALDEIAGRLSDLRAAHGAETLGLLHGTQRTCHWAARRFFNLFGSPNLGGATSLCYGPNLAAEYATYGGPVNPDWGRAACIVLWGHAPSQSDPLYAWEAVRRAKERGARLIVIDPRLTAEARLADLWLPLRPGTDLALMLGWLRLILTEKLYDQHMLERRCAGVEALQAGVAPWTPEAVARACWLSVEQVQAGARLFAATRPAVISWGLGVDKQGVNATQAARARAALRALTGNLDTPGGELLGYADPLGQIVSAVDLEFNAALPEAQRRKQLGADDYPLLSYPGWERLCEAHARLPRGYMPRPPADELAVAHPRHLLAAAATGQPYPLRAMLVQGSEPLLALPEPRRTRQALLGLELLVVMDLFPTPTGALADYLLPAAGAVERDDLYLDPDSCLACPAGVTPRAERRDDYQLWRELGLRLGQRQYWPWETMRAVCDYRLAPVGQTFARLVERGGLFGTREHHRYRRHRFGTPSGKIELSSSIFEALGCAAVPAYRPTPLVPEPGQGLAREYPLLLLTGSRFLPMYHSELRQLAGARALAPDPLVTLHPDTAARHRLAAGDWAGVVTPHGRARLRVALSVELEPRLVDVQHGWWLPERGEAAEDAALAHNAAALCPDQAALASPEVGAWPCTALVCRLERDA